MSDETYAAMERAIRAHVNDVTEGGYLSGWTLAASAVSPTDANATNYIYANHDGAPHEWLGLQSMARRRAVRWQWEEDT
jgi:hypothetical protein